MKNIQPATPTLAMHVSAAMALPFKISLYLFTVVIELVINIPVMNAVWRERRELELLTDTHIKDIGLSPGSVRLETKKGFFDIPPHRRHSWKRREAVSDCKSF